VSDTFCQASHGHPPPFLPPALLRYLSVHPELECGRERVDTQRLVRPESTLLGLPVGGEAAVEGREGGREKGVNGQVVKQ